MMTVEKIAVTVSGLAFLFVSSAVHADIDPSFYDPLTTFSIPKNLSIQCADCDTLRALQQQQQGQSMTPIESQSLVDVSNVLTRVPASSTKMPTLPGYQTSNSFQTNWDIGMPIPNQMPQWSFSVNQLNPSFVTPFYNVLNGGLDYKSPQAPWNRYPMPQMQWREPVTDAQVANSGFMK